MASAAIVAADSAFCPGRSRPTKLERIQIRQSRAKAQQPVVLSAGTDHSDAWKVADNRRDQIVKRSKGKKCHSSKNKMWQKQDDVERINLRKDKEFEQGRRKDKGIRAATDAKVAFEHDDDADAVYQPQWKPRETAVLPERWTQEVAEKQTRKAREIDAVKSGFPLRGCKRRAFVKKCSSENDWALGVGEYAWVFPKGLEVGVPVIFYSQSQSYRPDVDEKELAQGTVTSIFGEEVTFSWQHAIARRDRSFCFGQYGEEDKGEDIESTLWQKSQRFPKNSVKMIPESWEHTSFENGFDRDSVDAKWVDSYNFDVPEGVWSLLTPPTNIVFTVVEVQPFTVKRLRLTFTELSGEEFHLDVKENLTVMELGKQIMQFRGLAGVVVRILATDGSELPGQSTVSALAIDL